MALVQTRVPDRTPASPVPTLREVLSCQRPGFVAVVVACLAIAVFSYETVLITVFDAHAWWGHDLLRTALVYQAPFLVSWLLLRNRASDRRVLAMFLLLCDAVMVTVTWLPRQRPQAAPELLQLTWWAAWAIALYVIPAVLYARWQRQSVRSYGLRLGTFRHEFWIFALIVPAIAIGAWFACGQPRFQETYPFFRGWPDGGAPFTDMLTFWVMYAATFVALEFFFRGFMTSAGFRLIGWWAVPVMAAPYCLLHLDKPLPEMVTSLFGGLLLGVVALRTRSILAGVLAHVTLAIGTDVAVLGHTHL
mgnify:CR=1 FL=1